MSKESETPPLAGLIGEVVREQRVGTRFEAWIAPAIRHHEGRCARRMALLDRQRELVAVLEERTAELAKKQFPEPPILGWQQRTVRCFAELIDFAGHTDTPARAGLEGALEASGLLAAEVHADGTLHLADVQLVVMADAAEAAATRRKSREAAGKPATYAVRRDPGRRSELRNGKGCRA